MSRAVLAVLVASAISTSLFVRAQAQSPARGAAVTAPAPRVQATLSQLMKGTLYPESNVVFAAQDVNPADVPRAKDPNMATDLLASSYGKWEAVENSALAIAEVANLLTLPGRKCSNGLECSAGECGLGQVRSRASGRGNDGLRGGSNQESGQDYRCRRRDDDGLRELPR